MLPGKGLSLIHICSSYSNNNTNDLLLDNIEALANGEQENGITCIGEGTVDCLSLIHMSPINPDTFMAIFNEKMKKKDVYKRQTIGQSLQIEFFHLRVMNRVAYRLSLIHI